MSYAMRGIGPVMVTPGEVVLVAPPSGRRSGARGLSQGAAPGALSGVNVDISNMGAVWADGRAERKLDERVRSTSDRLLYGSGGAAVNALLYLKKLLELGFLHVRGAFFEGSG